MHICTTVYGDDHGKWRPIVFLPPFESPISAIAWYDASCCLGQAQPLLLLATTSGKLWMYNVRTQSTSALFSRKMDFYTALNWSAFSCSTFYGGTSAGSFVKCQVTLEGLVRTRVVWERSLSFPISFICLDPLTGATAAVASTHGTVSIFNNVDTDEPVKRSDMLSLCNKSEKVKYSAFFLASPEFLLIVTNMSSIVYALKEGVALPIIAGSHMQFLALTAACGSHAIVVQHGLIELRDLRDRTHCLLSDLQLSSDRLQISSEMLCFACRNDTLLILTQGWWLTTVELRCSRLFVTRRTKILSSKPLDWAVGPDQIAFATEEGKLILTRPHALVNRPPALRRVTNPPTALPAALTAGAAKRLPTAVSGFFVRIAKPPSSLSKRRGSSGCALTSGDLFNAIAERTQVDKPKEAEEAQAPKTPPPAATRRATCGCPCDLHMAFQVCDGPLRRVEWLTPSRLLVLSRDGVLYIVNTKTRTIGIVIGRIQEMPVTSFIVSSNRCFLCAIVTRFIVSFFDVTGRPQLLGSLTFDTPIHVTFRATVNAVWIVSERGRVWGVPAVGRGKLQLQSERPLDLKGHGLVTALAWRRPYLLLGSSTGAVLRADMSASPLRVAEVRQMRTAITEMRPGFRGALMVLDAAGNALLLPTGQDESEVMDLPVVVKNAAMCEPLGLIVRVPRERRLRVLKLVGTLKTLASSCAMHSPVIGPRTALRQKLQKEKRSTAACMRYGFPLMARILQVMENPEWVKQQALLLRDLFLQEPALTKRALHYSLLLKDFQTANRLLLATDPSDPHYLFNLARAGHLGLPGDEGSLAIASTQLVARQYFTEAVDLLLCSDRWQMAVEKLIEVNKIVEAAFICRVQQLSQERGKLMHCVARKMLQNGMKGYAAVLFGECRQLEAISTLLMNAKEVEQMEFMNQ
jgi:hypothetical protein